jgi:hypothetical protein
VAVEPVAAVLGVVAAVVAAWVEEVWVVEVQVEVA